MEDDQAGCGHRRGGEVSEMEIVSKTGKYWSVEAMLHGR